MVWKHTRFPRAVCPRCSRTVPAVVPSHGDGSLWVYRTHRDAHGERCAFSRRDVEQATVVSEGANWGSRAGLR